MEGFARGIVEDPAYRAQLKARAMEGELPPAMEVLLFHYAFGRPGTRSVDDTAFLHDLLAVVMQHADTPDAREAIRAVIDAHR